MTASPDSSACSVASHGSQVTTRAEVPEVSPRWMPTRSPTLAVAVGTAAARVVTGIRRLYAVGAELLARDELACDGVLVGRPGDGHLRREELPDRGRALKGLVLGGAGHREPVPAGGAGAEPREPGGELVLDEQRLGGLPVERPRRRLGVLDLVVLLLGADALDAAAHRHPDARGVLDGDARGPLDGERELVGALDPRHTGWDLEVGHPADRQDADVPLDLGTVALAAHGDGASVGDGGPGDVVGELRQVVALPDGDLGGAQREGRGEAEGARAVQEPLELTRGGGPAVEAGMPHELVDLVDVLGHRGDLAVRGPADHPAHGVQESLRGAEVDAEVDLLVGHAAAGEVDLVADEVLGPARKRRRGIGVVRRGPPRDGVGPGRDAKVQVPLRQLRQRIGGVEDDPLSGRVRVGTTIPAGRGGTRR